MKKNSLLLLMLYVVSISCVETISPEEVIQVRVLSDTNSIPADNISTMEVVAYISQDADDDKRTIKFETSSGIFTENSESNVEIKAEDTLELGNKKFLSSRVFLRSSNKVSDSVIVKAEIELYPARTRISFTEAPPSSLSLSADKFGVTNTFDSELMLTAIVKSDTGFPSSGSSVTFSVFDDSNNSLFSDVRFREEKLNIDPNGVASVIFTAGNLLKDGQPFVGDLRIECAVNGFAGISDSIIINVTSKTE